jgi:hypothetical protein
LQNASLLPARAGSFFLPPILHYHAPVWRYNPAQIDGNLQRYQDLPLKSCIKVLSQIPSLDVGFATTTGE